MRKRIINGMFLGVVMLVFATFFVGCSDYDDEIDDLQGQVDQLKKDLSDLKGSIGQYVTGVAYDAATGRLTVTGGDGSNASVVIGKDVITYTLSVSEDGKVTLKGSDGSQSEAQITFPEMPEIPEIPEIPAAFDPAKLTVADNGDVLYDGVKTGVSIPKTPSSTTGSITEIKDADENVIGYTIKMGEQTATFSVVDALPLKSLVFEPAAYLNGVEAMKAVNITYNAWTLNKSDNPTTLTGEIWNAPATPVQVGNINPDIIAYYHLNPASVTKKQIKNLKYIYDDKEFIGTRAATFNPVVKSFEIEKGMLKVVIDAKSQNIQKIDAEKISVMSLQVTVNNGGEDKVVTSDYAAIYKSVIKNLVIADKNKGTTHHTHLYGADNANALIGKAQEAIDNDPDYELVYNDTEGLDISKIVETHYTEWTDEATPKQIGTGDKVMSNIEDFGMKYVYSLSNYHQGSNQTKQNDFANLNGSILTAKLFGETGDPYAAVGRMPVVRVQLVDVATDKVINTGWIKVKIVKDKATVEDKDWKKTFAAFALQCDDVELKTTVEEMNVNIYNAVGLSKAEFHSLYTLDVDVNGNAIRKNTTDNGNVREITNVDGNTETTILAWTLSPGEVLLDADSKFTITVTYKANDPLSRGDFVITFTSEVSKPSATFANGSKIAEYWYDNMSAIEINAVVPQTLTNDCAIISDLDNVFVGNKPAFTVSSGASADFAVSKLTYKYQFTNAATNNAEITVDGTKYKLSVSADGTTLYASVGAAKQTIAVIDQATGEVTYNNDVAGLPTFGAATYAKALLNKAGRGSGNEFYAEVEVILTNQCDMNLPMVGGAFDARFLCPVNVANTTSKNFVDGVDGGSTLNMLDLVSMTDWRNYKFADNKSYYAYYDIQSIEIDIPNITCNLNGGNLATQKLSAVTNQIVITQNLLSDQATPNYGTVKYQNNSNTVQDFKLRMPVTVTYKWGSVKTSIDVDVKKTVE